MNGRRELISGFLAALVSIMIIGGGLAISFAERKPEISQAIPSFFSPTTTSSTTVTIATPVPGEPTPTPVPTTPTQIPSPTSFCNFPPGWLAVIVTQGDTLESLAETYQTSPEKLMEANCLFTSSISPGALLYVPEPSASLTPTSTPTPRPTATRCVSPPYGWITYTVKSGDTLYSISVAYGISVAELQAGNCMGSSTYIMAGETLWVPNIPTITPRLSLTPTPTATPTATSTATPTPTATNTSQPTATSRIRRTPTLFPTTTSTVTPTLPPTPTALPTNTPTPSPTPLPSFTPTSTPSPTNTNTPQPTATATKSPDPYPP